MRNLLLRFASVACLLFMLNSVTADPDAFETNVEMDDNSSSTCTLDDTKRYETDDGVDSSLKLPKIPIIMIPSFAGTRLRTWARHECGKLSLVNFNIGGSVWLDIKRLLVAVDCWIDCMSLDPETQDDITCKVRPDEGIDAINQVDESIPTAFLWKAWIHVLAAEGYEPQNSMYAHPFDWRIPPKLLELRDSSFTKLKIKIESAVKAYHERNPNSHFSGVGMFGHSLGNLYMQYFFKFLKAEMGERGLERWCEENVLFLIMSGSPLLGAPALMKPVFLGETEGLPMSDEQSRQMFLTFGSMPWMMPRVPNVEHQNPVHTAMNHGETDFPVPAMELTLRNGTVIRPKNDEILKKDGFFGKIGDPKFDKVQSVINNWYHDDANLDGNAFQPWIPPKSIDAVFCVYGVNLPTDVGYKYREHPKFEGMYEEEDVILNDRGNINSKSGEEVLPEHRRHATRKSGDGSVPYYSLSWCHSWLGTDTVNVTKIPAKSAYDKDEIEKFKDVNLLDPVERSAIQATPGKFHTFYRNQYVDTNRKKRRNTVIKREVWEIDGLLHRDSVTDPQVMQMFRSVIQRAAESDKITTQIREQEMRNTLQAIGKTGRLEEDLLESFMEEGAKWSIDNPPPNDEACYWDYKDAQCAWQRYCSYQYKFGDVHLSQSCRLRKQPLDKNDPRLQKDAIAHNVTFNAGDGGVKWRIIYKEKKGKYEPWQVILVSFVCGGTFLISFLYFIFQRYNNELMNFLSKRSKDFRRKTEGTMETSLGLMADAMNMLLTKVQTSEVDKDLGESIDELTKSVEELQKDVKAKQNESDDSVSELGGSEKHYDNRKRLEKISNIHQSIQMVLKKSELAELRRSSNLNPLQLADLVRLSEETSPTTK